MGEGSLNGWAATALRAPLLYFLNTVWNNFSKFKFLYSYVCLKKQVLAQNPKDTVAQYIKYAVPNDAFSNCE